MQILHIAVLLLAILGSAPIVRAEDPPETPPELRLSAEDTVEFAKQLILIKQVQNQALRKENASLAASLEAQALNRQWEALSVKFQEFIAQRRPRPDCEPMPTIDGKWNCPDVPEGKKEPEKK